MKYSFAGHETFPFRYAWLPKGVAAVNTNSQIFLQEDAMVTLGVGKNMVRSIKHWCEATGLIASSDRKNFSVTPIGQGLFGNNDLVTAWDPYLENPATLWLLHWQLCKRADLASTWYLAFSRYRKEQFHKEDLITWLRDDITKNTKIAESSLKRDVDVFIRTYTPSKVKNGKLLEDSFDSPLVELGLMQEIGRNTFEFVRGVKSSLGEGIFLAALIEYVKRTRGQQNTVSFEHIAYGDGSPGSVFKLSENALAERLENIPAVLGVSFNDSAGRRQLFIQKELPETIDVLSSYYTRVNSKQIHTS